MERRYAPEGALPPQPPGFTLARTPPIVGVLALTGSGETTTAHAPRGSAQPAGDRVPAPPFCGSGVRQGKVALGCYLDG